MSGCLTNHCAGSLEVRSVVQRWSLRWGKPAMAEVGRLGRLGLDGLDDEAEVLAVWRAQRDVAAMRAGGVRGEEAGGGVEILPAGLGELRGVRHDPDRGRDDVVAGPGLIGFDEADVVVGKVVVDGADDGPEDGGGDAAGDVVAIDVARHLRVAGMLVEVAFAVPERLAEGERVGRGIAAPAGAMHADDVDGVVDARDPCVISVAMFQSLLRSQSSEAMTLMEPRPLARRLARSSLYHWTL